MSPEQLTRLPQARFGEEHYVWSSKFGGMHKLVLHSDRKAFTGKKLMVQQGGRSIMNLN